MTARWRSSVAKHIISVRFSLESLKELDLYYHRPACELIFLTNKDHANLHGSIVKTNKRDRHGKNNPMYGKHHKEETKNKIGNKIRIDTRTGEYMERV